MGRYLGPKCRLCRREGMKLFLKGERCYTEKCSFSRRKYIPGMHWKKRTKMSDYGIMLREKQKVKRMYGLLEKQFSNLFVKAAKKHGVTGEILLQLLERRLDNVVYRLGWGTSRAHARQIVRHNHILLNGHKANIPSMIVNAGDRIEVKEKSRDNGIFKNIKDREKLREVPEWLTLDESGYVATVNRLPERSDITDKINEQLIVEYYSK